MALRCLLDQLSRVPEGLATAPYRVPGPWMPAGFGEGIEERAVDSVEFHRASIEAALAAGDATRACEPGWTAKSSVYNLLVRSGCAWDHDGDGSIGGVAADVTLGTGGHRETGTFLKAIALLPHVRRLGCDVLYLLPVTEIGANGRKGELGSPYAIRDPQRLDPTLADPLLGDLPVDTQFAALVEAAHRFGMRVVLEFVFRTAALDSRWVCSHPEWFYWVDGAIPDRGEADSPEAAFGAPPFSSRDLEQIHLAVSPGNRNHPLSDADIQENLSAGRGELVPPPLFYRDWFRMPPVPSVVREDGSAPGLRVPPAFADWPPDDSQPPWSDVTYLRLYRDDSDHFNYMSYNTLRVYDPDLATPENREERLWEKIQSIVPAYQDRFGIDGVMVDMGHALPRALTHGIQERARAKDPTFAFWEEKFVLGAESRRDGYEAVVGGFLFAAWSPSEFRHLVSELSESAAPVHFFATVENHNTPRAAARARRAGNPELAWAAWTAALFLPGAIPFVHAGFELGALDPVNTGLDFEAADLAECEGHPLALFDRAQLPWARGASKARIVSRLMSLRHRWASALHGPVLPSVEPLDIAGPGGVAFRVVGAGVDYIVATSIECGETAILERCGEGRSLDIVTDAELEAGEALVLPAGRTAILVQR